ncbi:inositol polyphosphate kinase KCS1 SKDI_04G2500 [Saccharomyces kudriavzevii IFO 1802]|uniref:Kinase n=2 Tax=Saccharomyces kudriavzevii (strain ATCC MYA-4449 / AS 2.2408 / CBS 8840 / NBRC 1802 / NCYC 2889) TaxID=226230 RepID=J6EIA6_SACK1|nr:uncharacterized protein SKDI_04G2500 [Saccharomyces kudriavzevii IFO 1802]EJT43067.1 KCS1-like protein [Saccharomyces kudriavzevii IFO 1802]CAI4057877.1 hypothetical protein SKDI_04G2500 [Saccharomyces kudriavzevii IFO 1802]
MGTSDKIHDKIPSTSREQQQPFRPNEPEECITTLKDLNVPETKKLSSVLHGRKASTYLRIFRDDECLADNNNSGNSNNSGSLSCAGKKPRTKSTSKSISEVFDEKPSPETSPFPPSTPILLNHEEPAIKPNKHVAHSININASDERGQCCDEGNDKQQSSQPQAIHRQTSLNPSQNIDEECISPKSTHQDTLHGISEDLKLKPVSSATYYPHKSKAGCGYEEKDKMENDIDTIQPSAINFASSIATFPRTYNRHTLKVKAHSSLSQSLRQENINNCSSNNNVQRFVQQSKPIEDQYKPVVQDTKDEQVEEEEEEDEREDEHREYPLAVELKPFTNRVGGHTAIFRFSKRAVCKALVNRENRWYENIELCHKELLQFMPRYIGVLNVRQHFQSKDDFLNDLGQEDNGNDNKNNNNNNSKHKYTEDNEYHNSNDDVSLNAELTGTPLTHIHSFPLEHSSREILEKVHPGMETIQQHVKRSLSSSNQPFLLPEVVLNDNRHIIPESLWYKDSDSPNSAPNDSYFSSCSSHNSSSFDDHSNMSKLKRRDSGSTMINTELRNLVIREVFAPKCFRRKRNSNTVTMGNHNLRSESNQPSLIQKSRASSHDASNTSVKALDDSSSLTNLQMDNSNSNSNLQGPFLKKSLHEKISNALEGSHSVMDLKQFHKNEQIKRKNSFCNSLSPILTATNSRNDGEFISSSDHASNAQDGVFDMDEDTENDTINMANHGNHDGPGKNMIIKSLGYNVTNDYSHHDIESITFEETSHTIVSKFILLEDLTRNMNKPCALDLKMGTRQYGVDAKGAKQLSQRAKCLKTTSRRLGVRVCGLKVWNKDYYITRDKYFGRRVKVGWQFARVIARFLYDGKTVESLIRQIPRLIKQLDTLYSEIFNLKGYRLYGASLLLMYDGDANKANSKRKKAANVKVNLIDFARCVTKEDAMECMDKFRIPPKSPNIEDKGFLRGVKSLKFYLLLIWNYLTSDVPLIFDETEMNNMITDETDSDITGHNSKFNKRWDWLDEFDQEDEEMYNDPNSKLRQKWRKYELIFDAEPRYNDDAQVSD